jgi:hypothetical protein
VLEECKPSVWFESIHGSSNRLSKNQNKNSPPVLQQANAGSRSYEPTTPEMDIWADWDYDPSVLEGFSIQATPEALPAADSGGHMMTMQTTTFLDEVEGVTVGEPSSANEFEISDATTSADLKEFLLDQLGFITLPGLSQRQLGR